jgi:sec-independent protein translocase protein TatB
MGAPPTIELGSLGMADSLILMVLALVVFGPRRLPQIGRQIGKLMYEFRKASNDFKFQMEEELRLAEEADRRKKEEEQRKQLPASQAPQESVSATPALVKAMQSADSEQPRTESCLTAEAESAEPTIMPPSTGETVASMRGSELAQLNQPAADRQAAPQPFESRTDAQSDPHPGPVESTKDQNAPAMEAANRNG